jgi:hypothetical protein
MAKAKNFPIVAAIIVVVLVFVMGNNFGSTGKLFASQNIDSCVPYSMNNYTNLLVKSGDFESATWGKSGDCNCLHASCKASPHNNPSSYMNWSVVFQSQNEIGDIGTLSKLGSDGGWYQQGTFEYLSRLSSDSKTGSKSQELIGRRANACVSSSITNTSANTWYTLSFWFKQVEKPDLPVDSDEGYKAARYLVGQYNITSGKTRYLGISFPVSDSEWHYVQTSFKTWPDTGGQLSLHIYAEGTNGELAADYSNVIRYDDIRIVQGQLPCSTQIEDPVVIDSCTTAADCESNEECSSGLCTIVDNEDTGFDLNRVLFSLGGFDITLLMVIIAAAIILLLVVMQ